MSDAPTLADYEELGDIEFDLSETEITEEAVNEALKDLYNL